ncbi:MAG: heavy metal-binding domain-containing protein [Rickettsiales bacterium]|jgi:uncharacterized protein YbjQ (UPF0145 family)|nr:heavy metal-binding domain-containing protein [Rickettsiales bacterium]
MSNAKNIKMIVSTTDEISGYKIKSVLGIVQGNTVQSKHIGRDLMAGLKGIIGGEIRGYTELLNESRDIAVERMIANAKKLGANAIVGVRFSTAAIVPTAAEIMVYGTAVKI